MPGANPQSAEPVAWRYISNAPKAKWTVQKNRPIDIEKWPGYTVEPLYPESALLDERQAREAAEQDVELAKDEGVDFVFDHLATALGLSRWVAEEGTETWEGDVCATLMRILRDSRAIDPETDTPACDRAEAAEASLAKAEARMAELEAALRPFSSYLDQAAFDRDNLGNPLPDDQGVGWVYLTIGDFRRARAALSSINKESSHG